MNTANTIVGGIPLTPCEFKLIQFFMQGRSRKEVAADLHKALTTLNSQMRLLFKKVGVSKINSLLVWATENGFDHTGKYTPRKRK